MQDKITSILKAIADPTRRELFHALVIATTAIPITQIAGQFSMTRQGVTKHLKILDDAGLVVIKASGRERICIANPEPLEAVKKWLSFYEGFWEDSLGNLGDYLDQNSEA